MAGKITFTITTEDKKVEKKVYEEHDTLIFGRNDDCHVCLPDDTYLSRQHFILEINPPDVRFRDVGSRNGTYVNGVKYGGRARDETPEEGAKHKHPQVDLHDGDELRAGKTYFRLHVESGVNPLEAVHCQHCGKDVAYEVGVARRGDYICEACQKVAKDDPGMLLMALLQQAQRAAQGGGEIHIPDYNIERKLGQGGMGAVYLVRHIKNGHRAALKVMLSKVAITAKEGKIFQREIAVTRVLKNKNVVELIENGAEGSIFYFLLEFCEGGSIYDLMQLNGGKLPLADAGKMMLQALEGLAYIHEKGFVHRDLKPQNILLGGSAGNWITKVADMGLAKNFDKAGFSGMTITGSIAGTFWFMPKEQVINFKYFKPVSDVWAMGATCYNILTGTYPRDLRKNEAPLEMIMRDEIIPIRQRDSRIPLAVAKVIDTALSGNVSSRYQNASEMRDAFAKALEKVK
ncbi:MAG: protein kinase domain-containing protein [Ktedonobacteraceae bacterium]